MKVGINPLNARPPLEPAPASKSEKKMKMSIGIQKTSDPSQQGPSLKPPPADRLLDELAQKGKIPLLKVDLTGGAKRRIGQNQN